MPIQNHVNIQAILKASGDDAGDLTGTIVYETNADGVGYSAGAGAGKFLSNGTYEYAPDATEKTAAHLAVRIRESTILTAVVNLQNSDLYKADVSNLDVAVSTRAPAATTEQIGTPYVWTNQAGDTHNVTKTAVP